MNARAIFFDVYNTLLEVGPAPEDAPARWETLWERFFNTSPGSSLAQFDASCRPIIAREHAAARQLGIPVPEIYWPAVACEALPLLAGLDENEREAFLFGHAQAIRTVRLMPGAAGLLERLSREAGTVLGIASNAQPYTLLELDSALAGAGLSRGIFRVCFWSFEHGFSKPDPHVFRLLSARLRALGVLPGQTAMIGDRLDNDIEPARALGWRTWHITGSLADPPDFLVAGVCDSGRNKPAE